MLRFALGLLYFLRFHVVFLFVKSYVGRKICALASHLHVFVSSQRGAVKILGLGRDYRFGDGGLFALGSVPHYMPWVRFIVQGQLKLSWRTLEITV